ncbi:MAG: carbon starvation CstA family protein [Lachnospiraceae bacterium]|nr:carbon starvation CstA family protein [Lachnospiraceae bacterium]
MITFLIGLVILLGGGFLYGSFCEHVFGPDDRETPAYAKQDGIDYVPMKTWRNSLINLLNIAGTGPIMGPIQGILFGPIAFLAIPIGNVIGGSMHDYFSGMICTRDGGTQMPDFIKNYTNKFVFVLYDIFICILLLLVGAVFIYTPGDIAATQLFGFSGAATAPSTWIIYGVIFAYYLIATCLPIDKVIGRIYPIFGVILVLSAVGIFIAIFTHGWHLTNIWDSWNTVGLYAADGGFDFGTYFGGSPFAGHHFIPIFFVTVACGILSGFHSTQTALVSRTIESEKAGKMTFYNMMIVEGFIAMCWAAGTMAVINMGAAAGGVTMQSADNGVTWQFFANVGGQLTAVSATSVVGVICKQALGSVAGKVAILGVIILPITSGDTALRGLRLTLADSLHIRQENNAQRLGLAAPVFALVVVILAWAKFDPNGFNVLWRYFAWSNQMISLFALACIAIWMMVNKKAQYVWMPLIPAAFYAFVTCSFIMQAKVGFNLPWPAAYTVGAVFTIAYLILVVVGGRKKAAGKAAA